MTNLHFVQGSAFVEGDLVFLGFRPTRPHWLLMLLIVPWLMYRLRLRRWKRSGFRITSVTNTTMTLEDRYD